MPVIDVSSVFIKTPNSIILCMVSYTQKNESDPFVKVSFKMPSTTGQQEVIKSVIEKVLVKKCSVTQIHVEYIELAKGFDALSAYFNGFAIAAKLAKLEVIDYLCSSTYKDGLYLADVAYLLNQGKVINFYTNGPMGDIENKLKICKKEAVKNAEFFIGELSNYRPTK